MIASDCKTIEGDNAFQLLQAGEKVVLDALSWVDARGREAVAKLGQEAAELEADGLSASDLLARDLRSDAELLDLYRRAILRVRRP